jgi:hypothetical protein
MKRLLILTAVGVLLCSTSGCRFWDCLWRGPSCRQPCAPVTGPCATPYAPSCNSCESGPAMSTTTPGPITTYSPTAPTQ